MRLIKSAFLWTLVLLAACAIAGAAQQLPLEPIKERGQGVYPVYEGWERTPTGAIRSWSGTSTATRKKPSTCRSAQTTRWSRAARIWGSRRTSSRGAAGGCTQIRVPADFGAKKLVWTVNVNGLNASVPMHLDPNWVIEPFEDAASKNRPPALRFERAGRPFLGPPVGVAAELNAFAAEPLLLALLASDVKPTANLATRTRPSRERLDLTWTKFRGPGRVVFGNHKPPVENGQA